MSTYGKPSGANVAAFAVGLLSDGFIAVGFTVGLIVAGVRALFS